MSHAELEDAVGGETGAGGELQTAPATCVVNYRLCLSGVFVSLFALFADCLAPCHQHLLRGQIISCRNTVVDLHRIELSCGARTMFTPAERLTFGNPGVP